MRRLASLALFVLLATACASTPDGPLVNAGVRNFEEVNAALSRGAQPTEDGVRTLMSRKIVTIVDLRPRRDDPAAFDREKNTAPQFRSYALSNWLAPSMTRVEEILATINNRDLQPVFVHCRRGADRTGTIVAAYRITHDCWTAEDAIREARAHGMALWQFPMRRFIRRWYQTKHVEPCTPGG